MQQLSVNQSPKVGRLLALAGAGLLLAGLYWASVYHYLLFHSLAEVFSIVIGCGTFMIVWNSREFFKNGYLMFVGLAFLFIAGFDLVHTLAYRGMGVFPGTSTNVATQLWVVARGLEGVSLMAAPLLLRRSVRPGVVLAIYSVTSALLLVSIFVWRIFPDCYVEGVGLTSFKRGSEYGICAVLLGAAGLLLRNRDAFDAQVLRWLLGSMGLTIASELAFTRYLSVYGPANLLGHYLKIVSFYFVYKAVIQTGLRQPYKLLFRELKQSEDRYHALFMHTINGVAHHQMIVNAAGEPVDYRFLEVNAAFERMTGLPRAGLVGRRVTEVIPGIQADPVNWIGRYGRVALKGEAARFEQFATAFQKWYSVTAYCPEPRYFVTVLEDITERKTAEAALNKAQEQLMQANESLERKVQERTTKLQETINDLEQFSYSIVHDMRAPLRAMHSFAGFVLEDCRRKLDPQALDYLQRIMAAAQRLDLLIQDVLNYSKVARGEFTLGPVDVNELLKEIIQGYPMFAPERLQIDVRRPLRPVLGHPALLTQCISNLLGNAMKFVAPGVHPHVCVWTEPAGLGRVRFLVRDNGIGIEEGQSDRIWRIFERLHHAGEYPGTGIGLSVVRKAVERMGGGVGVDSQPGHGSTFWFELRAAPFP